MQVLHITGPQHAVEVPDGDPAGLPYVVIPYVEEMQYAYVPLPLRGGEQRLNAEPAVSAGGALLVDDAGLDPAWIEIALIPVPTDPGRSAAMSVRGPAAGSTDADVVLAWHLLTAVAERRRFAS